MNDLSLKVTKTINAPIEDVFDAWLDPAMLTKFMLPAPGMPNPKVEADGSLGGRFTIMMMVGDKEIPHSGEYLTVQRPNKLAFSWESPFSTQGSIVTLDFRQLSCDSTEVILTHVKFADETSRDNHEGGWGRILAELEQLIK